MCLATIIEDKTRKRTGYKVMHKFGDNRYGALFQGGAYTNNYWYKAHNHNLTSTTGHKYKSGFHIFLNYEDAELYRMKEPGDIVCKVKFRKVLATGTQIFQNKCLPCIVADEMLIVGECKHG